MRKIKSSLIKEKVKGLTQKANIDLRADVLLVLKKLHKQEKNNKAKNCLSAIIENARVAKKDKLAICQDTGLPVVFVEIGNQVCLDKNISEIINQAVAEGYKEAYFRASIQGDPISRKNYPKYAPVIVHTDIINGDKLKITLLPKGFGSENKAKVKMFNPTACWEELEDFIVDCVAKAGASACPPYVVGVGIGGTQDLAGLLAKKALLRPLNKKNKNKNIACLENKLLKKINALHIGPLGLGHGVTALVVAMETYPTHIAGLPVAVNINCHALRSASVII